MKRSKNQPSRPMGRYSCYPLVALLATGCVVSLDGDPLQEAETPGSEADPAASEGGTSARANPPDESTEPIASEGGAGGDSDAPDPSTSDEDEPMASAGAGSGGTSSVEPGNDTPPLDPSAGYLGFSHFLDNPWTRCATGTIAEEQLDTVHHFLLVGEEAASAAEASARSAGLSVGIPGLFAVSADRASLAVVGSQSNEATITGGVRVLGTRRSLIYDEHFAPTIDPASSDFAFCGEEFYSSELSGAEVLYTITAKTTTTAERDELQSSLGASLTYNNVQVAGGVASAQAAADLLSRYSWTLEVRQTGGAPISAAPSLQGFTKFADCNGQTCTDALAAVLESILSEAEEALQQDHRVLSRETSRWSGYGIYGVPPSPLEDTAAWLDARRELEEAHWCSVAAAYLADRGYLSDQHLAEVRATADDCELRSLLARGVFDGCRSAEDSGDCARDIPQRLAELETPEVDMERLNSLLELDQLVERGRRVSLGLQFLEFGGQGAKCAGVGQSFTPVGEYTNPITLRSGEGDSYCQAYYSLKDPTSVMDVSPVTVSHESLGTEGVCLGTGTHPIPATLPSEDLWAGPLTYVLRPGTAGCRTSFRVTDPTWRFGMRVTGGAECGTPDSQQMQWATAGGPDATVDLAPEQNSCALEFTLEQVYEEVANSLGL